MPLVFINENDRVVLIHHKPELLSDERKAEGYEVESIPERPQTAEDERAVRYFNKENNEVYWKIETVEVTE